MNSATTTAGAAASGVRVWRFSGWARLTHLTLALSVFGLALTGMPLKYHEAFWAWPLMRMWGGAANAGVLHRIFAIGLASSGIMHLGGAAVGSIRRRLPPLLGPDSLVPRLDDLKQIVGYVKYLRGKGPRPEFGKFTYWEKFDYLAVFWGLVIIGLSGVVMWIPEVTSRYFPGWIINAALIVHSDEALLATGFLFSIHFFNTHLRPEAFPFEEVIVIGRQSLEKVAHERPGWHSRIVSNSERAAHVTSGPDDPAPTPIRLGGIAFLILGTVTLLLVMSAAIAEAVRYLIALLT
ncbi:MAG: cytochrome b/b6 domain-containing protein [Actinomycetota bacterium]